MSEQPPAGWHTDPADPTQYRYWDGQQWTDQRSPKDTNAATTHDEPAKEPAGKPWWKKWWGIALIVLVIFAFLGSLGEDPAEESAQPTTDVEDDSVAAPAETEPAEDEPAPAEELEETEDPEETEEPPAPEPGFSDGTHAVGDDIEPGTYRADGNSVCYWVRSSDFSGDFESIIANGNNVPEIVTIAPDDAAFETRGCGRWLPVEDTFPATPATEFENGTFVVGEHIEPGRYKADGSDTCYWARLSDFTHAGIDGVIVNGNNATTIEIAPNDAGFTAFGCGTWTKMG